MDGSSSKVGTYNGEKRFWRTRLIIIISLSMVIIACSYAASGNIFLKTQHVTKLLNQDKSTTVIYTNNPQIEIEMNKVTCSLFSWILFGITEIITVEIIFVCWFCFEVSVVGCLYFLDCSCMFCFKDEGMNVFFRFSHAHSAFCASRFTINITYITFSKTYCISSWKKSQEKSTFKYIHNAFITLYSFPFLTHNEIKPLLFKD